eukprot:14457752-Heterocapsa_arctica.AAC.1
MEQCNEQVKQDNLFLFEQPWSAQSWQKPCVQHVMALPGVRVLKGPMCRWGMKATDQNGRIGYVKKETGWMTNSPELADALEGYC